VEADSDLRVVAYVDASDGVHADLKSHTGLFITLGRGPLYCKSGRQKITTKSSTEAELVGLSDSIGQAIWTRNFMESQGHQQLPAKAMEDNTSTIALVKSGKATSERGYTPHIDPILLRRG
jgi:hypothetical protein